MTSITKRQEYRNLFKQNVAKRLLVDKMVRLVVIACVISAIIPLCSILVDVFVKGAPALSIEFLTEAPGAIGSGDGGIGPAIQGTFVLIGMTSLIGVPIGIMSGILLAEFGDNHLARSVRFFNDVFMEFPSIVLGIFAFLIIVLVLGYFSVWAAAFALALIMFPIVARTTEEAMKMVPITYREAGMALGLKQSVVITRVVLSAAKNGLVTGILLAVARISGETAPLIMTILGSNTFLSGFDKPVDALPLRIWNLSNLPFDSAQQQGWGAALVLIIIILAINLGVRYFVLTKAKNSRLASRLFSRTHTGFGMPSFSQKNSSMESRFNQGVKRDP